MSCEKYIIVSQNFTCFTKINKTIVTMWFEHKTVNKKYCFAQVFFCDKVFLKFSLDLLIIIPWFYSKYFVVFIVSKNRYNATNSQACYWKC